uniref:NADH dehydrogenase subunit I n=1 Tax=Pinguicula vulgaris TaxID=204362 RepID=UPI002A7EEBE1|nr:NADH dehydrogenase subunit I [Pinguicula vulgaris]WOL38209.1 NADH dehydrogenase subunit I [Pinguicula vulgaris]
MTEEYELSTYDRHEFHYNEIALGRLPVSIIDDYTIRIISSNSPQKKMYKTLIQKNISKNPK